MIKILIIKKFVSFDFPGDSGGGLVLPQLSTDGSYYYYNLVGIVSYGFECNYYQLLY